MKPKHRDEAKRDSALKIVKALAGMRVYGADELPYTNRETLAHMKSRARRFLSKRRNSTKRGTR